MPSSANRRRLEVPSALYARLEGEARRRQMTAAALATALLADALDRAEQGRGAREEQVIGEVHDVLRQLLEREARQTAELQALRGELLQVLPPVRPVTPATVTNAPRIADLARAFDPQDWAELRLAGRGARGKAQPFKDLFEGSTLPPPLVECLRLLLISDLAQSPDLRAEYLRQARALHDRMAPLVADESIKGEKKERDEGNPE